LKGYSKLNKAGLIELIKNEENKQSNKNINPKIFNENYESEDEKEIQHKIKSPKKEKIDDPLNILDITNDFNTKIASVKVAYLRTIGYESFEEWLKDPNNFYTGRHGRIFIGSGDNKYQFNYSASIFGNPFKPGDDINDCLEQYYDYIKNTPELYNKLDIIKNKTIGCWCGINDKCHAKVLIKLLKEKDEINKKK
jgi:hypothetical protein